MNEITNFDLSKIKEIYEFLKKYLLEKVFPNTSEKQQLMNEYQLIEKSINNFLLLAELVSKHRLLYEYLTRSLSSDPKDLTISTLFTFTKDYATTLKVQKLISILVKEDLFEEAMQVAEAFGQHTLVKNVQYKYCKYSCR